MVGCGGANISEVVDEVDTRGDEEEREAKKDRCNGRGRKVLVG